MSTQTGADQEVEWQDSRRGQVRTTQTTLRWIVYPCSPDSGTVSPRSARIVPSSTLNPQSPARLGTHRNSVKDFPAGPVVGDLPASAGFDPWSERSRMLWSD